MLIDVLLAGAQYTCGVECYCRVAALRGVVTDVAVMIMVVVVGGGGNK